MVKGKVEDSAWMAHSEILLLTLLASDVEEERHFAVNKTLSNCGNPKYSDSSNWPLKVPKLNWKDKKLEELIDWNMATESILTARLSNTNLRFEAFSISHSQRNSPATLERLVKENSAASAQVFGAERRDGCVHARCSARKLVPKVE